MMFKIKTFSSIANNKVYMYIEHYHLFDSLSFNNFFIAVLSLVETTNHNIMTLMQSLPLKIPFPYCFYTCTGSVVHMKQN